ncbi:MAG: hypothetical protein DDT21_02756 [Syntrophomonadaceae bacterium]|nr:hypothetical protein [Bacillota bacterium]
MGVGGFDTNLPCNEDTDLAFRLVNAGYKYQWAPALAVYNTDHRRLRRGIGWRYAHMLVRSFLVFISLRYPFLRRWLYVDWGYW